MRSRAVRFSYRPPRMIHRKRPQRFTLRWGHFHVLRVCGFSRSQPVSSDRQEGLLSSYLVPSSATQQWRNLNEAHHDYVGDGPCSIVHLCARKAVRGAGAAGGSAAGGASAGGTSSSGTSSPSGMSSSGESSTTGMGSGRAGAGGTSGTGLNNNLYSSDSVWINGTTPSSTTNNRSKTASTRTKGR